MEKASPRRFVKSSLVYFIILFFSIVLNTSYTYANKAASISDEAEDYRTKGYEAQQRGDIDTAIEWYQKAVNLKPEYASPHNDLGILFEIKGWMDRAEAEYNKALTINPNYKEVHANLALLNERRGDLEKAAYHWMRRYKLGSPEDPWTQEAKNRLEKLGLLDKTEKDSTETKQQVVVKKQAEREKPVEEKPEPVIKKKEVKKNKEPKQKKESKWTKIGSENKKPVVKKVSKSNKNIDSELQESLRLAEERLKEESVSAAKGEVKTKSTTSSESSSSYNKAKDYYNKGEYTKALDTIRLAEQNSSGNKLLLELEEEIKFK